MGVIRAFTSSLGYIADEQWKEMFYCDAMGMDVLLQRGYKHVGARSTNTRMDDQVITNGSLIMVNEGQALIVTANGKVIDVCTEPGEHYFYDEDHPSGFRGFFNDALSRVAYGGGDVQPLAHRVYYVNIMECMGNVFETEAPVCLRVGDESLGLDMDGGITMSGVFSYKITDPVKFYKLLVGNITGSYTRHNLNGQIRAQLLSSLQPSMELLTARGFRPSQMVQQTDALLDALVTTMNSGWCGDHGIAISSIAVNGMNVLGAGEVRAAQQAAMLKDPAMAKATMTGAFADSMRTSGGAAFLAQAALGASRSASNPLLASRNDDMVAYLRGQKPAPGAAGSQAGPKYDPSFSQTASTAEWVCSCGTRNTGNFCTECGKRKIGGVQ